MILPRHLLEEPFTYNPGRLKEHWFGRKPIGWGPWMIEEYRRRSHIILVPNPHYWDRQKIRLKKITYRFIRSTNSLKAALEAGNIDATSETGLGSDEVSKLENMYPERWNYHYRSGLVWEHIDLRSDYDEEIHKGRPNPLEDVRVRQALAHGANRQLLADAIFDGKVRVAHSYLPDVHYAYHKSLKNYDYNPDKARKLLDAAGWKMGANGIRKKDGETLKLRFGTTAENKIRELVQQVLQQDWKQIGIEIEVNNEPPSAFFGQTTHKRKFPHMAMYAWLLSPITAGDTLYRGDKIPSPSNNWQGQNYAGLRNDELTRLAIEGEKALDLKKRIGILQKVQEICGAIASDSALLSCEQFGNGQAIAELEANRHVVSNIMELSGVVFGGEEMIAFVLRRLIAAVVLISLLFCFVCLAAGHARFHGGHAARE